MATKIVTKNSSTASAVPTASDLVQGELAVNVADKRLFTEDNAGAIVELGTNPSALTVTGNVGIGTSSPSANLEITQSGNNVGLLVAGGSYNYTAKFESSDAEANIIIEDSNSTNDGNMIGVATNDMYFITAAAERMRISSAGNVGIGTTSPSKGLHLNFSNDLAAIRFQNTANAKVWDLTPSIPDVANSGFSLHNVTDNTVPLHVDNSGNVGIGTSSPAFDLDILDTSTASNTGAGVNIAHATQPQLRFAQTTGNYRMYVGMRTNDLIIANDSGAEKVRFEQNGNVGIGTSSPVTALEISTDGTDQLTLNRADASISTNNTLGGIVVSADDPTANRSGAKIGFTAGANWTTNNFPTNIIFSNDASGTMTERMRIDSAGNVGIGCTPASKLDLDISTNARGSFSSSIGEVGSGNFALQVTNSAGSALKPLGFRAEDIRFATGSAERMRIDSSGNLLVGKTSANDSVVGLRVSSLGVITSTIASPSTNTYLMYSGGYKFYVNTNGGISNLSANNVNLSDEREKKNIELLESQWDSLKQWSLKKFHYNADDDSDNKKLGVIAQEVETHNPEVIDEFNVDDETTRMAVKEQQMMWMAIKALQEAQTRIETLETRVTELENN